MTERKSLKQIAEEGIARERAAREAASQAFRFVVEGRRQGKTIRMQEMTEAAIERGENLYLPASPPMAEDDLNGE